jgi:DNA-binding NarL/FixJ family response regulator
MKRTKKSARILLADDHAVVIEGLRRILRSPQFNVVGAVSNGRELVDVATRLRPDLIVTDFAMPQLNGLDATRKILAGQNPPKIIFLTMHPELAYAIAALDAGVKGYVLKTAAGEELTDAIRAVLGGRIYLSRSIASAVERARTVRSAASRGAADGLTDRQREVLQLLAEGKQVKEIAAILKLSPKTVEFHKYRIMDVIGAHTLAEIALYAARQGIIT